MNLLALETSTELCSVALWSGGKVAAARDTLAGQRHSELLLPMVDELMTQQGLNPADLNAIAFGAGPGSFTGLRIACGVAQGIAFATNLPVIAVGTLQALAAASGAQRALCCLDARMGEIYHAAYELHDGDWITVSEPVLCSAANAPDLNDDGWTACGSGFVAHGAALAQRYAGRISTIRAELVPHAREVAALAARGYARGEAVSAELAAPFYIRDKVALRVDERKAALRVGDERKVALRVDNDERNIQAR